MIKIEAAMLQTASGVSQQQEKSVLQEPQHSKDFIVARARRFLEDFAADDIEELAEYLAEAGFADVSVACRAIRSSLAGLAQKLQSQREIEQATIVEGLLQQFDELWRGG